MTQDQFTRISSALQAIGDAARLAERRGDDLGEHSISSEEHEAQEAAFRLIATELEGA